MALALPVSQQFRRQNLAANGIVTLIQRLSSQRLRASRSFADSLTGDDEELSSGDESDDGDDTSVPCTSDAESILPEVSEIRSPRTAVYL